MGRGVLLTLHHHLVTGHQYLLSVAGLRILQDGGAGLGGRRVGHGERLQALNAVSAVVGQLDGAALRDGDCERRDKRVRKANRAVTISLGKKLTILAAAGLVNGRGHGDCGDGGRSRRHVILRLFLLDARDGRRVRRQVVQNFPVWDEKSRDQLGERNTRFICVFLRLLSFTKNILRHISLTSMHHHRRLQAIAGAQPERAASMFKKKKKKSSDSYCHAHTVKPFTRNRTFQNKSGDEPHAAAQSLKANTGE